MRPVMIELAEKTGLADLFTYISQRLSHADNQQNNVQLDTIPSSYREFNRLPKENAEHVALEYNERRITDL